ncbi:MAG: type IX secretion system membrane protein PorP/SprF [Bacteroidetes bacterium]|nr:type IX secretion system membrane protein PorP/SprF [Bacteroidota bacterium]
MKRILLFLLAISTLTKAQNDFQLSNFMFNEITFNPAATGNTDKFISSLIARKQWIGMDRSPASQFFNTHAYVEQIKGGLGLTIINDKIGYENALNLKLSYAYHIKLSQSASLSAGLSAGFINKKLDGAKLIYEQSADPGAIVSQTSLFLPDFSTGLEFNAKNFTTGISSTHITQSLSNATVYKVPRHYFYYAKYKFEFGDFSVTPVLLIKSALFITQPELNTNVMYKNLIWVGTTYRYKESIVGLIGFAINKIRIGYTYDFNSSKLRNQSNGSHEIMLQAVLKGFSKKKYDFKSPRFF